MDRSPYAPMTSSTEGPNPLRPYYRPPSTGIGNGGGGGRPSIAARIDTNSSYGIHPSTVSPSLGSSARDILSDLDYRDILRESGGQSTAATVKSLLDQAVWKYTSMFMAQPFELAKMVLQTGLAHDVSESSKSARDQSRRRSSAFADSRYPSSHDEEEDDDDEPSYFTSTAPGAHRSISPMSSSIRSRRSLSRSASGLSPLRQPPTPPLPSHMLELKHRDSLLEVISQLWAKEGAWGIWKGTNVSFLYSLLFKTTETWTLSMLCAIFNLPSPGITPGAGAGVGGLDIIDSPSPLTSLLIAVTAAGVSGFLLSPLDIIRTRIMLTTTSAQPRSILPCLRSLPSWTCPPSLFAPTMLHSTLPILISTSTPLVLRTMLQIDPIITPATYSVCTFMSSTFELFIKLPIETVLRRGQIKYASEAETTLSNKTNKSRRGGDVKAVNPVMTVVDVGPYYGVLNTMWHIARDEGESIQTVAITTRGAPPGTPTRKNSYVTSKGQGIYGLWRGWRVGWWGLVGVWGAAALGNASGKGGEF